MTDRINSPGRAPALRRTLVIGLCALAIAMPGVVVLPSFTASPAYADPPPWAPAHGYRAKKRHKKYKRKHRRGRRGDYEERRSYDAPAIVVAPVVASPHVDLSNCNRQLIGSVVGGATGALIGSRIGKGSGKTMAIATGTIIGLLVGGSIGRTMDSVDQSCVGNVLEQAETGQTVAWKNPDGEQYQVTPQKTYQSGEGRYCREYTTTVTVGGKAESAYGTACRQPDGTWQIVKR